MGSSDRRVFLQGAGATLMFPLIAGGASLSHEQDDDGAGQQLLRELVATIKRAGSDPRAEHLHAAAAYVRVIHVHNRALWRVADRSLAKALADAGGANNLAAADASDGTRRKAIRAALREHGLDEHQHAIDVVGMSKGLEVVRDIGHAAALARVAAGLDRLAAGIESRGPARLVARQVNSEICSQIFWNMVVADSLCFAASMTPGGQVPAISICAVALWLHMMYSLNGCG